MGSKIPGQAATDSGSSRRGERSDEWRLAGSRGHRPEYGVAIRNHAAVDRRHAVRRIRTAADFDHVHAAQPVSRGARAEAGASAESERTEEYLHPLAAGRRGSAERVYLRPSDDGSVGGESSGTVP